MSKFYAQINADNIVEGVTQAHSVIDAAHMIELQGYEIEKLDNKYDPATGLFTPMPKPAIRMITTKAFFRRLTFQERTGLRNSARDAVADLREDLQRSVFVDLDDTLEQQLLDTGLLQQDRIDALLVDGTIEET